MKKDTGSTPDSSNKVCFGPRLASSANFTFRRRLLPTHRVSRRVSVSSGLVSAPLLVDDVDGVLRRQDPVHRHLAVAVGTQKTQTQTKSLKEVGGPRTDPGPWYQRE